jgi:hypothetical protein
MRCALLAAAALGAQAFVAPGPGAQGGAWRLAAAGGLGQPPQLRVPLAPAGRGVPLQARRGGMLDETYADPYVVLGVPKEVLLLV